MNNRIYPREALEKAMAEYRKKFIANDKPYHVYIIECSDGTYYTGYTTRLIYRLLMHMRGKGAKYTRGRRPLKLVYTKEYLTKSEAMKREYQIKKMTRKQKVELINA